MFRTKRKYIEKIERLEWELLKTKEDEKAERAKAERLEMESQLQVGIRILTWQVNRDRGYHGLAEATILERSEKAIKIRYWGEERWALLSRIDIEEILKPKSKKEV